MYVLEKIRLKIVIIKSRSEFEYTSRSIRLLVNAIYSNHVICPNTYHFQIIIKMFACNPHGFYLLELDIPKYELQLLLQINSSSGYLGYFAIELMLLFT
jgi:hypothetical protein